MARNNSQPAHQPDEVLEFSRMFDAPRELVWRLWREPEHMVRWHGPEGYWLTDCRIDFRVGGKWSRTMSRAADHAHRIYGEYLDIREPERLQFTYINDFDGHEMVVTLDFEDEDGKTLMRFHQTRFVTVEERDSHGWGWGSSLELFASYLAKVKAADGKLIGRPRREGVAEDIVALRNKQEDTRNADAAKDR